MPDHHNPLDPRHRYPAQEDLLRFVERVLPTTPEEDLRRFRHLLGDLDTLAAQMQRNVRSVQRLQWLLVAVSVLLTVLVVRLVWWE